MKKSDQDNLPQPPSHLSSEAANWWTAIVSEFELLPADLKVLQAAAESWDRAQQARQEVEADGLTVEDRWGQKKQHPAVNVERDSRAAFVRCVRELRLDGEEPGEPGRPPSLSGKAQSER
jgi:P27 family predicted phage terminase small subunit